MELIDTHCHLDAPEFDGRVQNILNRAVTSRITTFIIPGIRELEWSALLTLCEEHEGLLAAPGLHPLFLKHHSEEHIDKLSDICNSVPIIAIGEIGLDFFDSTIDQAAQQILFEKQLQIAQKAQLPIILHVRKAHDQVLATLRRKKFSCGGIVHAFSGSFQQANQYIQLGFGIGIGGTITYTRAKRVRALAANLPQTSLVLETDAPDMTVASHRGEENLPEYLIEVLHTLATVRDEEPEHTASYTTINTKRIFGL